MWSIGSACTLKWQPDASRLPVTTLLGEAWRQTFGLQAREPWLYANVKGHKPCVQLRSGLRSKTHDRMHGFNNDGRRTHSSTTRVCDDLTMHMSILETCTVSRNVLWHARCKIDGLFRWADITLASHRSAVIWSNAVLCCTVLCCNTVYCTVVCCALC